MAQAVFPSSFDATSKVVTLLALLLIGYLAYDTFTNAELSNTKPFFVAVILVLLFISFGLNSGSYIIRNSELIIDRPIAPIRISLSDIRGTEVVTGERLIRVFGIGGLGGWYGKFWNSKIGMVTMLGRNQQNLLLIKTLSKGNLIICPDDMSILQHLKY